ncbi:LpqN/LpqT family lipoprotein [Mycolicibacterium komossense]|uniref:LpqN/LpqT family lipoprotein n=1 Tax=Mycolicibacterium komossense TaxID=1779 RepID=A0ABT3CEG9_9MYCO|nr:LpqN/LpqT family lipoprotein [Mycolicibacterium komossense]MCV7227786.1 LpqN/LpqT family lipoprotein [Mycolicibacterium komossense]
MKRLNAASGAGVAVLALSLALAGCGSDSKTTASSGSGSTSAVASSSETTSAEASATSAAPTPGTNKTIADYVKDNNITETSMQRGDPGPNINVPLPPDWQPKQGALPEGTYGAIVYAKTAVPTNPPRVLALLSKLTGNVDPAEILKYAPGELNNLPGFTGDNQGEPSQLSGFNSVELAGTYNQNGKQGMISQKTVVIPADNAVYVLQLNGFSDESEAGILNNAMNIINEKTTITP